MSLSSDATPHMIEWARLRAGYSLEAVVKAEGFAMQDLLDWESGKASPSLSRLRKLAKRYKRPLMVFYLPEPPKEFSVVKLKDFRRLPNDASPEFSPELMYAIRLAKIRQEWAASYLDESGEEPCPLVATAKVSDNVVSVASKLRESLGMTLAMQVKCRSVSAAFSAWKRSCEAAGFYVFQSSKVQLDEMRGCALSNHYAPVVIVNPNDSYSGRTFTLLHEVAHLLLGQSAITGGATAIDREPQYKVERFCNAVAAEVLVPKSDLLPRLSPRWRENEYLAVSSLASRYRVSRQVIAIRLVEIGAANRDWLSSVWPLLSSGKPPQKSAAIPQHVLTLARTGESFARLAVAAYQHGEIHGGELASLLKMSLKHLPSLVQELYPSRMITTPKA